MYICKQHRGTALFSLLAISYILIVYPIIKEIRLYEVEKHGEHHQSCQCGCGGNEMQCSCEAASGIVGFRYCTIKTNSTIPLLPLWISNEWNKKFSILSTAQSIIPPSNDEFLHPQEVLNQIEHPPPYPLSKNFIR
jgi:hypothetical protein